MSFFSNRRQQEPAEPAQTPERRAPQPPQSPQPQNTLPIGFETVLGANTSFAGDLVSESNVRLDGTFTGTLKISGNVLIGETAKINADVNAKNISIAGAVRGNVNGKKVQLLRTGRVWGDITATALSTEEGAFIDGKISMVTHEATSARLDGDTTPDAQRATDTLEAVAANADTPAIESPIVAEAEAVTDIEPDFLNEFDLSDEETSIDDRADDNPRLKD